MQGHLQILNGRNVFTVPTTHTFEDFWATAAIKLREILSRGRKSLPFLTLVFLRKSANYLITLS